MNDLKLADATQCDGSDHQGTRFQEFVWDITTTSDRASLYNWGEGLKGLYYLYLSIQMRRASLLGNLKARRIESQLFAIHLKAGDWMIPMALTIKSKPTAFLFCLLSSI